MAQVFKLRVKSSFGGVPTGYEFQHVENSACSTPSAFAVKETLMKLGFSGVKNLDCGSSRIEVVSKK